MTYSNIKIKTLLKDNKITEAKEEFKRHFFPLNPCGFIQILDNGFKLYRTRRELLDTIPLDIDNFEYLEQHHMKKTRDTVFKLKDFISSCEFHTSENSVELDINFNTEETIFLNKGKKYINMAQALPFNVEALNNIDVDDFKEEIDLINKHILKVLVSGDAIQYEYFINWLAHTIKGQKLRTCLYLQSKERTGKGIFLNFINEMLGSRMLKTSSLETIHTYTKPLEGRVLINFDELPEEGKGKALSDRLKSLITEPLFDCRKMYENGYSQKNTFNIIITSNNNAVHLTNSNNSRYVCCDVSDSEIGNTKYFNSLKTAMSKEGIHQAYFKYLLSVYEKTKAFNFDKKPQSKTRTEKLAVSMPSLMRHIKESYILKGFGLNVNCKNFIEHYNEKAKVPISSITAHKQIKEMLGIVKKRVYDKETKLKDTRFICEKSELYNKFINNNWIVPEFEEVEEEGEEEEEAINYDDILKEKDAKIKELELLIKQLQAVKEEPKKAITKGKAAKATKATSKLTVSKDELQTKTGSINIDFSF